VKSPANGVRGQYTPSNGPLIAVNMAQPHGSPLNETRLAFQYTISRRASLLCANSCTGYRSNNGSRTSWRLLLSRRSTVGPHCIFTNSFETIRLPEHFDLLYRSTVLPTICVHRLRLSGVLLLCTSSLELSRDIHKIDEHL